MLKEFIRSFLKSKIFRFYYSRRLEIKDRLRFFMAEEEANYYTQKLRLSLGTFGTGSRINGKITVLKPKAVLIGNNVHIGSGAFLDGRGGLIVGDNAHFSREVTIYTTNHNHEGENLPYDHTYIGKEVIIGKNVWIGMHVRITPGVTIGDGAIIGMGAVISKNVKEGEIVVTGVQRTIGKRNWIDYLQKKKLKKYGGINGYSLESEQIENYKVSPFKALKVIFVLSTGRAGSTTIAKMFQKNQKISSFHETFYTFLDRLSIEYITGKISKDVVKEKLINYFNSEFIKEETIYIESDQKLVPFVEILNEIFNCPKFIWLTRHPRSFMHSAATRGWYKDDQPTLHNERVLIDFKKNRHGARIAGDLTGDYSSNEWVELDQRSKILWYWKFWNLLIEKNLSAIPEEQKMRIHLEKIDNLTDDIYNFIGIENENILKVPKSNPVKKAHAQKYITEKKDNMDFFDTKGYKIVEEEMQKIGYHKR